MKRLKFDESRSVAENEMKPADPSACAAWGCPMRASVAPEGRFLCSCHAVVVHDRWQAVTQSLRDHDWLIGFITTVQKLYQTGKDAELRKFAHDFWVESDHYMLLTEYEAKHLPLYLLRLRGELSYRVGASTVRPAPRTGPMHLATTRVNNLPLPDVVDA